MQHYSFLSEISTKYIDNVYINKILKDPSAFNQDHINYVHGLIMRSAKFNAFHRIAKNMANAHKFKNNVDKQKYISNVIKRAYKRGN